MQKFTEFVNEQKLQRIAKSKEEQAHKFNDLYESKLRQFGVSSPIELNEEQSTEFFEYVKSISKNSLEVNEAAKFKSTKDFLDFLEEIDSMPESAIKKIMGKDYIDTPGNYAEEAEDYDNDIEEYTISNMGKKDYEKLKSWWENNVAESVVNEGRIKAPKALEDIVKGDTSRAEGIKMSKKLADHYLMWLRTSAYGKKQGKDLPLDMVIKASFNWGIERGLDPKLNAELAKLKETINESNSELNEAEVKNEKDFAEYAEKVLRKAHGDKYDEKIGNKIISDLSAEVKKSKDADWGMAVGKLTSGLAN